MTEEPERNESVPSPSPSPRSRRAAVQKLQLEADAAAERDAAGRLGELAGADREDPNGGQNLDRSQSAVDANRDVSRVNANRANTNSVDAHPADAPGQASGGAGVEGSAAAASGTGGAGNTAGVGGPGAESPRRGNTRTQRSNPREPQPKNGSKATAREAKERKKRSMRRMFSAFFFVGAVASGLWLFFGGEHFSSVKTSEGISLLRGKQVERVQITEGTQQVRLWLSKPTKTTDDKGESHDVGKQVQFSYVEPQAAQIARLTEQTKPKLGYDSIVPQVSIWSSIFTMAVPMLIIIVAFMFLLPRMQSGMGAFGRIKDRKQLDPDKPNVTFDDVAGEDEAVAELREITEFLTAPERFHALGAEIPRGVLLYGPPGTGKTLLARAVAGEAGVPFYSISASEFVEMFVGVGASRVRDLFNKAKENAPAIVFVDEIDAVGRGRGVGIGGGNDEREQTLNQLLVELDGFDSRTNVILIAATNRPDVLDPALLRPGRFDRQISVDAPDLRGREAILKVHARGKPFAPDVDLAMVARRTPGYTGADLENILNEAALLAARFEHAAIGVSDVDEAIDRVMAGPQRRSRPMNDQDKLLTAYHEAGHALTAAALHNADPVTKVTILPRGRALGYTMVLPTEDRYSVSRNDLLDQLTYAMGGRVAEEIVFHDPTTGASNDIQKATNIARSMVTEYGMSAEVGIIRLAGEDADPLERTMGGGGEVHSDGMVSAIDMEARGLVENAHREAWAILAQNRALLDTLASRLMEKETVLEAELKEIFADVVKAPVRERWNVFDVPAELLVATEIPPIEIRSPQPAKGRHAAKHNDSEAHVPSTGHAAGDSAPQAPMAPPAPSAVLPPLASSVPPAGSPERSAGPMGGPERPAGPEESSERSAGPVGSPERPAGTTIPGAAPSPGSGSMPTDSTPTEQLPKVEETPSTQRLPKIDPLTGPVPPAGDPHPLAGPVPPAGPAEALRSDPQALPPSGRDALPLGDGISPLGGDIPPLGDGESNSAPSAGAEGDPEHKPEAGDD